MKASDLRHIAIKNNTGPHILDEVEQKMRSAAANGKFEYRHFPDALPDHVLKELKKQGYKVTVQKGEYETTDTTISWQ
jgi:hypothetical protein